MMLSALLAAMAVSILIIWGGKLMPQKMEQKKSIQQRIFTNAESQSTTKILRQDRLSDIQYFQSVLEKQLFSYRLTLLLKRAGAPFSVAAFCLLATAAAIILFMTASFFLPFPIPFMTAALGLAAPFYYLNLKNKKYIEKFSTSLPDATSIISNALKIGQGIEQALIKVAKTAPAPLSTEFQTLAGEVKLGIPLETALKNLYERVKTPELKIFTTGICIQQELGGNLSEIMGNLETTIRERFALDREIKVLSAQGIMSMRVLTALPFGFGFVWASGNKKILMDFLTAPDGIKMICFAAFLQIIAFIWMKKIVDIQD